MWHKRYSYSDRVYLVDWQRLCVGDILLTHGHGLAGWIVRVVTRCPYAHASIYAGHGSILESTSRFSFAANPQRWPWLKASQVKVLRYVNGLSATDAEHIVTYVRERLGERYSVARAASSVLGRIGVWLRWCLRFKFVGYLFGSQYCSHLVSDGYASVGISLTRKGSENSPADLWRSNVLVEIPNMVHLASAQEIDILNSPDLVTLNKCRVGKFLTRVRLLAFFVGSFVRDLDAVHQFVHRFPRFDELITRWVLRSRYHTTYRLDVAQNPFRYHERALIAVGLSPVDLLGFVQSQCHLLQANINRYLIEYLKFYSCYARNRLSYDRLQMLLYRGMLVIMMNSMQMFERRLIACGFAAHQLVTTLRSQVVIIHRWIMLQGLL